MDRGFRGIWRGYRLLLIGVVLLAAGVIVYAWRLVDPERGAESFVVPGGLQIGGLIVPSLVVGAALVLVGTALGAVWFGVAVLAPATTPSIRDTSTEPTTGLTDRPTERAPGIRPIAIGALLMFVGAVLLSFPAIGSVWADVWFSAEGRGGFPYYSLFEYFPVTTTIGVHTEIARILTLGVGLRRVTRALRKPPPVSQ